MKMDANCMCDVCGKPRGIKNIHAKCSKIRQKRGLPYHEDARKHLSAKQIEFISNASKDL